MSRQENTCLCHWKKHSWNDVLFSFYVNAVPVHAIKTCRGAEVWFHSFLTLATRCRKVFRSTALATSFQEKERTVCTDRRLGGLQIWSGRIDEEKNLVSLPWIEPRFLGCQARGLVTVPTTLSIYCLYRCTVHSVVYLVTHTNKCTHAPTHARTHTHTHTHIYIYIYILVFSLRGRVGRNQSPVMWLVWLWHTASWASPWG